MNEFELVHLYVHLKILNWYDIDLNADPLSLLRAAAVGSKVSINHFIQIACHVFKIESDENKMIENLNLAIKNSYKEKRSAILASANQVTFPKINEAFMVILYILQEFYKTPKHESNYYEDKVESSIKTIATYKNKKKHRSKNTANKKKSSNELSPEAEGKKGKEAMSSAIDNKLMPPVKITSDNQILKFDGKFPEDYFQNCSQYDSKEKILQENPFNSAKKRCKPEEDIKSNELTTNKKKWNSHENFSFSETVSINYYPNSIRLICNSNFDPIYLGRPFHGGENNNYGCSLFEEYNELNYEDEYIPPFAPENSSINSYMNDSNELFYHSGKNYF